MLYHLYYLQYRAHTACRPSCYQPVSDGMKQFLSGSNFFIRSVVQHMMDSTLLNGAINRITKVVNQCCDGSSMYEKSYKLCEDSITALICCCKTLTNKANIQFDWDSVQSSFNEAINSSQSNYKKSRKKSTPSKQKQVTSNSKILEERISKLEKMLCALSAQTDIIEPQEASNEGSRSSKRKEELQVAFHSWKSVLNALPDQCAIYPQVSACASILKYWFNSTFNQDKKLKYGFNVSHIRDWVINIIIGFGNHMDSAYSMNQYCDSFKKWCSSDKTYIVPGEEYRYLHKVPMKAIKVKTLVIWDLLYDAGLNQLELLNEKYAVSREMMYSKLDSNQTLGSDKLRNYKDYRVDESILDDCGIRRLEALNYEID